MLENKNKTENRASWMNEPNEPATTAQKELIKLYSDKPEIQCLLNGKSVDELTKKSAQRIIIAIRESDTDYRRTVRKARARAIAITEGNRCLIACDTQNGHEYRIWYTKDGLVCECPDFQHRGRKYGLPCKHLIAAQSYLAELPTPNLY
jgi:hypothetical protein